MTRASGRRVAMFMRQQVHTGGERYLVEVFTYLQRHGVPVEPIYLRHSTEAHHGPGLVLDCLLANFRLFRQARELGDLSDVVFFEDFHRPPRPYLFGPIMKAFKKPIAGSEPTESVLS